MIENKFFMLIHVLVGTKLLRSTVLTVDCIRRIVPPRHHQGDHATSLSRRL